jgi:transcriptional regulator with GAF, ATPase, and Fis domain
MRSDEYEQHYAPFFAHSAKMRAVRRSIERVADTDATILIRGESGVGKEVVAKAVHLASSKWNRPFVKVNCAALPAELLESELFGHEKGAFTGAYRRKPGKFELAEGGTILLDEIGEMPFPLQAKLLHALQDHEFARVGGSTPVRVDVRVIASTNRALESAVASGQFREDLYYRLKVITLTIPPLRERVEEIPVLAQLFVHRFNQQYGRNVTLDGRSLHLLTEYSWPGNVRELENMIKRVVVLQDTTLLEEEMAAQAAPTAPVAEPLPLSPARLDGRAANLDVDSRKPPTLSEVARRASVDAQRKLISEALEQVNWNRAAAARILNISYKSLLYKIDQCGLGRKRLIRSRSAERLSG